MELTLHQLQLLLKNGGKWGLGLEGGVAGLHPLLGAAIAPGEILEGVQDSLRVLLLLLLADLTLLQQQLPALGHARELARLRVIADMDLCVERIMK